MKKSSKAARPTKARRKNAPATAVKSQPWYKTYARSVVIAVVVAVIGLVGAIILRGQMIERDLTQVGQGTPTIVQVHDVQCPPCNVLQGQTRSILKQFDDGVLDYRVADIKSENGLAFATEHRSSYTTLLLFDGEGNLNTRIVGPATDAQIEQALQELVSTRR